MEIRESDKAAASYRTVQVIGLGLAAGLALYLVIGEVVAGGRVEPHHAAVDVDLARKLLLVAAIAAFGAAAWVRRRMLETGFGSLEQTLVPGERLRRMTTAAIVGFLLCDTVAAMGLVLLLLGGSLNDLHLFIALAFVFHFLLFPRAAQWQRWYGERTRLR